MTIVYYLGTYLLGVASALWLLVWMLKRDNTKKEQALAAEIRDLTKP